LNHKAHEEHEEAGVAGVASQPFGTKPAALRAVAFFSVSSVSSVVDFLWRQETACRNQRLAPGPNATPNATLIANRPTT
jgi:hypothetical protein